MNQGYSQAIEIDIANGNCDPDFEPPERVKTDYEYEIGKDKRIVINFKGASNGNCFFESNLEIDGPSKSVALYRPEILVQDAEFENFYKKISDASLTI